MNNLSVSVMTNLAPTKLPLTAIPADPECFLNLVTGAAPANATPVAETVNPAGHQPEVPTTAVEAPKTTMPAPQYNARAADLTNLPRFASLTVAVAPTLPDPLVQNAPIETVAQPKLLEGPAWSFVNASTGVPTRNTPTNQAVKKEMSNILASLPEVAIVEFDEQDGQEGITPIVAETLSTTPLALLITPATNRHSFAAQGDNKTNVTAATDRVGTHFIAPMELPPKPASFQFSELINWTSTVSPNPLTATPSDIAPQLGTTAILDLAHDNLWLDQLAKEIAAFASNDGRLRFSLSPPALGNLDVAIQTEGDGLNIQLQPSTESAARIFAAEQPKLVEELRQFGVRLNNSDLLGGHQGHGQREHTHMQYSPRQIPDQSNSNTERQTQANALPPERRSGKFA
jgi:flagellar hook-length control protein FliK